MPTLKKLATCAALAACTFALCACAGGTDRIEDRQDARSAESSDDTFDGRDEGWQERLQSRSDRSDARYGR